MIYYLLIALSYQAQAVPLQITQQGRILENAGTTVLGVHDVTFRLYDTPNSGSPLWSESLLISFNNGYYAAILGTDESGNPLDSSVLGLYPLYLELQLDSNTPMTPRQEITSVPYAQIAGVAESVDGGTVNASNVQIGSIPVIDGNRNWLGEPITVDWSSIQNIPGTIIDGDDNTQLNEGEVENYVTNDSLSLHEDTTLNGQQILTLGMDSDTLADISCSGGDIPKWDAIVGQWGCELDQDSLGILSCSDGQVAVFDQGLSGWVCGAQQDTFGQLNCSAGQVAYFDGTSWTCQNGTMLFDQDEDNIPTWEDCDDNDSTSYTRADDIDCDGFLPLEDCDNADPSSFTIFEDADCDGTITYEDCDDDDANSTVVSMDADCDGNVNSSDCNDNDNTTYVGASEICGDGVDQDCDGIDSPCFGDVTFTSCGQTGESGPSQSQCNIQYENTELEGDVLISSGIQYWTVPATAVYTIEVKGASGGDCTYGNGGAGAVVTGDFELEAGTELKILVGQEGGTVPNNSGGGGGGTYVVLSDDTPLIIAGGGGGAGGYSQANPASLHNGLDGTASESGTDSVPSSGEYWIANGYGGNSGQGGTAGMSHRPGGGGGGLLTDGGTYSSCHGGCGYGTGGKAFIAGGLGGTSVTDDIVIGGFGGGGGGTLGGGGGGGYSGGGGGTWSGYGSADWGHGGGGGGSYSLSSNTSSPSGGNEGHGLVNISLVE